MKKIAFVVVTLAGLVAAAVMMSNNIPWRARNKNQQEDHYNYYQISGARVPDTISFAGEKAPLDKFYVLEALDKEIQVNTYWHSSTLMLLKRANRWFPVIEPILEENNIPNDFKYVALIESGLENVVSPAGATGFWQLLKGTAKDYGLEVNKDVDERYHVEKATQVACEYLREAYTISDNWTLAAASYNAGKRRIRQELNEQGVHSFYDLYLNAETSRYIYRILAIKLIYENPSLFGFSLDKEMLYDPVPTQEVAFSGEIQDLIAFSKDHNTTYKMLKTLNPWLVNRILRNSTGKEYIIKLPAGPENSKE